MPILRSLDSACPPALAGPILAVRRSKPDQARSYLRFLIARTGPALAAAHYPMPLVDINTARDAPPTDRSEAQARGEMKRQKAHFRAVLAHFRTHFSDPSSAAVERDQARAMTLSC